MTNYLQMTDKDLNIKEVLDRLINIGDITESDVSESIGKSLRQVQRIKKKYKELWPIWIIHWLRWKPSNHKEDEEKYNTVKNLIKINYSDFNAVHIAEKLEEVNNIGLSPPTIRKVLVELGFHKVKSRKENSKMFFWRKRKDNYWEMQQYDWSYHKWLEDRNWWEELCLNLAIDDATWDITKAEFDLNEWIKATFHFWKNYFLEIWRPLNIYVDKFATYKINHPNASFDENLTTQFGRVCKTLWVKLIFANTPQAKWRVERVFSTLQDRLVKELRLANICNITDANKFLKEEFIPKFNKKFRVPACWNSDLHLTLRTDEKEKLDSIFSIHDYRKIQCDFTVMYKNKFYQLYRSSWVMFFKWEKVKVIESLDGNVSSIQIKDKNIEFIQIPKRLNKAERLWLDKLILAPVKIEENVRKTYFEIHWKHHPWMNWFKIRKSNIDNTKTNLETVKI